MEVYDLSEENKLDMHMSGKVPVPEGDEAQSLTQEELGQGQEDHCWFNHRPNCTTSVFPKNTEDVWFLEQAIWREEHKSEDGFEKIVEEEVENAEVVIVTLNCVPGSWDSFIRGICARWKWLLLTDSGNKKKLDSY